MPTDTFYRLPESKREHVLSALQSEIARSPFENFSINNVLRDSGISRGSFYQYFRSKEDIYLYFLAGYQKSILSFATKKLSGCGGDLFEALESSFRFAVRMLCYKDSREFRHNLFCNMWMYEMLFQKGMYGESISDETHAFLNEIDRSRLNLANDAELQTLVEICMTLSLKEAAGICMADKGEEEVNENFARKLALLRKAYQKQDTP